MSQDFINLTNRDINSAGQYKDVSPTLLQIKGILVNAVAYVWCSSAISWFERSLF